jgi:hypothetical protein
MSGDIGGTNGPLTVVIDGALSVAAATHFRGVVYLRGGGTRVIGGPASGTRPIIQGALLADGNLTASNLLNIVHDDNQIRRASYASGSYAPTPGGWSDKLAPP